MRVLSLGVIVIGLCFALASEAQQTNACEDILLPGGQCPADAGAAAAACCPCDNAKFSNHGRYVSCVAHAANTLRKAECLDLEAKRSIKRCAARSTCGKPGFVTCCMSESGVCEDGFCAKTDPALACTTDIECPVSTRCSVKQDSDTCLARGGTPGTGSCCGACAAP